MRITITRLPTLFAALLIAGALVFGAATALEGMPQCTAGLPPHTCPTPTDCDLLCQDEGYPTGTCILTKSCCKCVI